MHVKNMNVQAVHTGVPSGTDASRGHLGDAPATTASARGSSRRKDPPTPFSTSPAPAQPPSSAGAALGAFSGMLMTERVGRIKPCVQIVKMVGQVRSSLPCVFPLAFTLPFSPPHGPNGV